MTTWEEDCRVMYVVLSYFAFFIAFFASLYTPRTHVTFYNNFVLETKELEGLIIRGSKGVRVTLHL